MHTSGTGSARALLVVLSRSLASPLSPRASYMPALDLTCLRVSTILYLHYASSKSFGQDHSGLDSCSPSARSSALPAFWRRALRAPSTRAPRRYARVVSCPSSLTSVPADLMLTVLRTICGCTRWLQLWLHSLVALAGWAALHLLAAPSIVPRGSHGSLARVDGSHGSHGVWLSFLAHGWHGAWLWWWPACHGSHGLHGAWIA